MSTGRRTSGAPSGVPTSHAVMATVPQIRTTTLR